MQTLVPVGSAVGIPRPRVRTLVPGVVDRGPKNAVPPGPSLSAIQRGLLVLLVLCWTSMFLLLISQGGAQAIHCVRCFSSFDVPEVTISRRREIETLSD